MSCHGTGYVLHGRQSRTTLPQSVTKSIFWMSLISGALRQEVLHNGFQCCRMKCSSLSIVTKNPLTSNRSSCIASSTAAAQQQISRVVMQHSTHRRRNRFCGGFWRPFEVRRDVVYPREPWNHTCTNFAAKDWLP